MRPVTIRPAPRYRPKHAEYVRPDPPPFRRWTIGVVAATVAVALASSAIGPQDGQPQAGTVARGPAGGQAITGTSDSVSLQDAAHFSTPGRFGRATDVAVRQLRATDSASAVDTTPASALAASGIPSTALVAYQNAAAREQLRRPSCGLGWPLLAAIGRVESNHGRFAGAVLHADGLSTPPVIGIPLNGHGTALIRDTDNGRLDGDRVYDRAVGPMQFIPSTWAGWGVDANGDGIKDPFNIFDAAAAAADYLCAAGRDLRTYAGQVQAVRSYNNSDSYIALVLQLERVYASGAGVIVPTPPAHQKPVKVRHRLPPVDPGKPRGIQHDPNPSPSPTSPSPAPTSSNSPTSATPSPSHGRSRTPAPPPITSSSGTTAPGSTGPASTSPGSSSSGASPSGSPTTCPTPSDTAPTPTASPAAPDSVASGLAVTSAASTTAATDGRSSSPDTSSAQPTGCPSTSSSSATEPTGAAPPSS